MRGRDAGSPDRWNERVGRAIGAVSRAIARTPLVGVVLAAAVLTTALVAGVAGTSHVPDERTPRLAGGFLSDGPAEVNRTRLEYAVHREINRVRDERGRPPLEFDAGLREISRYHSRDMAEADYFAHDAPNGETLEDRYGRFGYDCRAPITDRRYATSGENIAVTWYGVRVRSHDGTVRYDSAEAIAEGVVRNWMHSPGHRENLLREYWRREGVGVHLTERDGKTTVYVTQNFC